MGNAASKRMMAMVAAAIALLATDAASAQAVQIFPAGIYPLTPEREQSLRPRDSFKECDICPEMVVVPKGSFMMGTPADEHNSELQAPAHHVCRLPLDITISRVTITFDEWDACLADGGCNGYHSS